MVYHRNPIGIPWDSMGIGLGMSAWESNGNGNEMEQGMGMGQGMGMIAWELVGMGDKILILHTSNHNRQ